MEELSLIDFIEGMQPEKAKVAKPEIPELTVSEISFEIKRFVETAFGKVRVRGEIFGAKRADSGHYYLSLKDENAVLSAVCWKGVAAQLAVKPEDGLEVVATGKVTTFAGKSSYQLVIEQMEVAGTGALLKLLEERKKQYADEGLFDAAHKQKIPYLPKVVGVVTSASGAVIRDIIHRIRDRFPRHVLLWPTRCRAKERRRRLRRRLTVLTLCRRTARFQTRRFDCGSGAAAVWKICGRLTKMWLFGRFMLQKFR